MKFPNVDSGSKKSHISNNRLYTHDPSLSAWTYNIENLIPAHHWKFCNPDDTLDNADDSGSIPDRLFKHNGATFGNSGKIAYSTYINSGDYLKSTNSTSEEYTEFTFAFWIKKDTLYTIESIEYWYIYQRNDLKVYLFAADASGQGDYEYGVTCSAGAGDSYNFGKTDLAEWTHITVSVDTVNDVMKWYFNGEFVEEDTGSYTTQSLTTSDQHYIGNDSTPSTATDLIGYLEDFRIYDRVLNGQEISLIFNQGQGTYQQSIPRGFPTFNYPCDHIKLIDNRTTYNDSGYNPNANWQGNGTNSTNSLLGNYCYTDINGRNNYSLSGSSLVCGSGKKNVSFWYKSTTHTNDLSYIMYSSTAFIKIQISGNTLYFQYPNYTTSLTKPDNDIWHHISINIINDDTVYTFIDGILLDSGSINSGTCPTLIIFLKDNFSGYVQDIRFFCNILTYFEIRNLYNNGNGTLL